MQVSTGTPLLAPSTMMNRCERGCRVCQYIGSGIVPDNPERLQVKLLSSSLLNPEAP